MMKQALHILRLGLGALVLCGTFSLASAGQVMVWNPSALETNVPTDLGNVVAVAAGDNHCLALQADGSVIAWGLNSFGQANVPPDLTNVVSVAAGSTHSLALRRDGSVALWGHVIGTASGSNPLPPDATNLVSLALGPGAQHVLGLRADGTVLDTGNPSYPSLTNPPPSAHNVVAVAAGCFHSLALRADGQVVAWGSDPRYPSVVNVPASATNIVAIASGWRADAALRADGTVLVWGKIVASSPVPGFTNIVDVALPFSATGYSSLLGLKSDGTLLLSADLGSSYPPTYPTNQVTAIGAGSIDGLLVAGTGAPVFPGLPANRTVPRGSRAYFRLLASGAQPIAYQWTCNGTNLPGATNSILTVTNVQPEVAGTSYALVASNALGMATSAPVSLNLITPCEAYLQSSVATAIIGQSVTLTASPLGQGPFSYQWQHYGTNLPGVTSATLTLFNVQLANAGAYSVIISNVYGLLTNSLTLPVVPSIVTSTPQNQLAFAGGTTTFSLGLSATIPVAYQWQFNGVNLEGATTSALKLTNLQAGQTGTYRVLWSDAYESVTNDATLSLVSVAAWGQLGQQSLSPEFTNLLALAAGKTHWLGLRPDGTVLGWGDASAAAPSGLSNVIAVAAGNGLSLALKGDGTVVAWGNNAFTGVPPGLTNVVAIAAGDSHALALQADGSVTAWGDNSHGQTTVPAGLTQAVALAAGGWNSLALQADGTVVAWGDNTLGQTNVPAGLSNVVQIAAGDVDALVLQADGSLLGWGSGSSGENTRPAGLSNIVAIAAGYGHSVALSADGTVTSWGYNSYGQAQTPAGLTQVTAICAKSYQSAALIGNGPPPTQAPLLNPRWSRQGFSLDVSSQSGHTYRLEYTDALTASNWTALPLVAGTGGLLTLTDPSPAPAQRFYRLRRW